MRKIFEAPQFLQMLAYSCLSLLIIPSSVTAQDEIPLDYKLLFEINFDDKIALDDFVMTDPKAWRIGNSDDNRVMELYRKSEYEPRVRSPFNIAVIKDHLFGSFVLEVNVKQTGQEYGHRDLCFFWGMKDASNFYYAHLASAADEHAHNIFLVNDEPRVAIAGKTTAGVQWGLTWHRVRIVRELSEGTIKVYFDDMTTPIMEATDKHFTYGYIGFGSFDDVGMFDNIKIWGEPVEQERALFH